MQKFYVTPFIVSTVVVLLSMTVVVGVIFIGDAGVGSDIEREAVVNGPSYTVVEHVVQKGDTWETIAKAAGIDWGTLGLSLLDVSKDTHSLASIREGNAFRFLFDEGTRDLVRVEYDVDDEKMLVLDKAENYESPTSQHPEPQSFDVTQDIPPSEVGLPHSTESFGARIEDIEYDIVEVVKRGIIENSLFETAQRENIPAAIIMEMAGMFAWDVDFASSVQPGDSFVLLYEERYREGKQMKPGKILAAKFVNAGREVYAFYYEVPDSSARYYNEEGRELRRQFLRSPLDYKRITSGFSYNRFHPILQTFTTHRAIDYAAPAGTPISATADGIVTHAGWKGGNGRYVRIRHENGYETGYAHLSAFAKGIRAGARIKQNQVIGFVGSTGWSTGPHLHYEMLKNGSYINPLRLDLPPGKMMAQEYRDNFFIRKDELLKKFEN